MPFGIHEGDRMEDVPATYLLWLEQGDEITPEVQDYINWARSALLAEIRHGGKFW
jgi:hypothetical protein